MRRRDYIGLWPCWLFSPSSPCPGDRRKRISLPSRDHGVAFLVMQRLLMPGWMRWGAKHQFLGVYMLRTYVGIVCGLAALPRYRGKALYQWRKSPGSPADVRGVFGGEQRGDFVRDLVSPYLADLRPAAHTFSALGPKPSTLGPAGASARRTKLKAGRLCSSQVAAVRAVDGSPRATSRAST